MNPADVLKEGDEVEAVVLSVDVEKQRVSQGLKQIEPDPWIQVPEKYGIGTIVRGKIVNITNFGAFAKLEEGVEGLIHISELDERHVDNPEEIVSVGEELDLKVISLDPEERRIGLSLKEAKEDQEESVITRYMDVQRDSDRATLGDMMDRLNVSAGFETEVSEVESTAVDQEDAPSEDSVADEDEVEETPDDEVPLEDLAVGEIEETSDDEVPSEDVIVDEAEETSDEQEGDKEGS